ncbi:MAG TPA: hypothetical protein VHH15_08255 [Actinophytocola sp.]|nr:hypothetical protein [Actinophytocola sp.]
MTTSITNRPAPRWLRELAHGRAAYEELLGWPVSVRVSGRALVLATGPAASAVVMPAALGALVRKELCVAMQRVPILSDSDGGRWTFLIRPPESLRPGVGGELAEADVVLAPPGGYVVVPTSPAGRQWVEPPLPTRGLPPAYPVIAVTRRLTARRHLVLGA